jgi:hypothetical protein
MAVVGFCLLTAAGCGGGAVIRDHASFWQGAVNVMRTADAVDRFARQTWEEKSRRSAAEGLPLRVTDVRARIDRDVLGLEYDIAYPAGSDTNRVKRLEDDVWNALIEYTGGVSY